MVAATGIVSLGYMLATRNPPQEKEPIPIKAPVEAPTKLTPAEQAQLDKQLSKLENNIIAVSDEIKDLKEKVSDPNLDQKKRAEFFIKIERLEKQTDGFYWELNYRDLNHSIAKIVPKPTAQELEGIISDRLMGLETEVGKLEAQLLWKLKNTSHLFSNRGLLETQNLVDQIAWNEKRIASNVARLTTRSPIHTQEQAKRQMQIKVIIGHLERIESKAPEDQKQTLQMLRKLLSQN